MPDSPAPSPLVRPQPPPPPRSLPQVPRAVPPPFALPGLHFAASVAWLVVAAGLLPWLAPRIAMGQVLDPPVLALVHVAMLGALGSAIFGALYQFVPGGLEVPLRSVRLGFVGLWTWQLGTAGLVLGFLLWSGPLLGFAWVVLFASVGAASVNILPARRRSPHGRLVGAYLSVAHSALGLGMAIALARIGEALRWWQLERLGLLGAHLQLGLVGFGTLTAIGVGSRMIPTFLVAQGNDGPRLRRILAVASAGLVAAALSVFGIPGVTRAAGTLLLLGGLLMLELAVRWFRRRVRRSLDPALWHVATAFVGLAAGVGWGAALLVLGGGDLRRWAAYVATLALAWLLMLVTGVMAKIVSHLSYIHLFTRLPGFARVGDPNRLLRAGWMKASWGLLSAGALLLPVAFALGEPVAARGSAALWSLGVAITAANYVQMFVRGRWSGPPPD